MARGTEEAENADHVGEGGDASPSSDAVPEAGPARPRKRKARRTGDASDATASSTPDGPREPGDPREPRDLDARDVAPPPKRDLYRPAALGVAFLFLFPMLAKSGIWDPYELDAADLARRVAVSVFGAKSLEIPNAANALPTLSDLKMGELPFTSMALGFKLFGLHDWSGRLPLAVWGLVGVWVLYELLARLVDRRAGLYAAIALVTMPLYFIQARTMLGDIVTMSAMTIAFSGLLGALLDEERRVPWALVGGVGLVAGYLCRGAILGVSVPALAVGLTWAVLRSSEDRRTPSSPLLGPMGIVGIATLVVGVVAGGVGVRALMHATADMPVARTVGFSILRRATSDATFDLTIRQLGHALFPWSALIPFALGRVLRPPVEAAPAAREREMGVRIAIVVCASLLYGASALLATRSGNLPFAGPALFAAALGLMILDADRGAPPSRIAALTMMVLAVVIFFDLYREQDKALAAFVVDRPQFPKTFEVKGQHDLEVVLASFVGLTSFAWIESQPKRLPKVDEWLEGTIASYRDVALELSEVWNGNLLFACVVLEAGLVGLGAMILVGKKVGWARLEGIGEGFSKFGVNAWWILPVVLAILPILVVAGRDGLRAAIGGIRVPRAALTLVGALIAGGTLSFGYFPDLAAQLSPKEAFDSYAHLAHDGEPLALLSVRGRTAAYYGGGDPPSFTDANQAFSWMTEGSGRRWLLLKADDLPRMNALYRNLRDKNLPILDGRSSQILLASNELGGAVNQNSIGTMVLDEPVKPVHPLDAMFEDQLQALGWDMVDKDGALVDSIVPSRTYRLRTYYRVLKPITTTWKLFVHIDGFQRRFNGDHNVLDGKYPMNQWRAGDVVVDDFELALEPNFTQGSYTLFYGFFSGETRFKVTRGHAQDNRIVAGSIEVR